jgi:hypothetical protein
MDSPGLIEFLETVGSAVHSLNTVCVGLHGVERSKFEKPEELTVSWHTNDPIASARKSRLFAVKASFVFVEEALLQYLKYAAKHPLAPEAVRKALSADSAAERIEELAKVVVLKKNYWAPMVMLMIHWRNRFVHASSKACLKPEQRKLLLREASAIKENHASIDIQDTLSHFDKNSVTLKDASTLIAVSIRLARNIDELLAISGMSRDSIRYYLEYNEMASEYRNVLKINGVEVRERKVRAFFKTYLPFVDETMLASIIVDPIEFGLDRR